LNPHAPKGTSYSGWHVYLFHHPDVEPPPGVEPDRPPYESGAAASARRHKLPLQDSNLDSRLQGPLSCQLDERALVRAVRFERTDDPFWAGQVSHCRHARVVRRQGFEPRTSGLRSRCSARLS
jgi:hypothetical protein